MSATLFAAHATAAAADSASRISFFAKTATLLDDTLRERSNAVAFPVSRRRRQPLSAASIAFPSADVGETVRPIPAPASASDHAVARTYGCGMVMRRNVEDAYGAVVFLSELLPSFCNQRQGLVWAIVEHSQATIPLASSYRALPAYSSGVANRRRREGCVIERDAMAE